MVDSKASSITSRSQNPLHIIDKADWPQLSKLNIANELD